MAVGVLMAHPRGHLPDWGLCCHDPASGEVLVLHITSPRKITVQIQSMVFTECVVLSHHCKIEKFYVKLS